MLKEATFMKYALKQAQIAMEKNEVPVGAVVVKDGFVISSAHNLTMHTLDPTAHAEVLAIRKACDVIGNYRLTACELYVTLEPCCMCAGSIMQSRLNKVTFGAFDAKSGVVGSLMNVFENKKLNHQTSFEGGVLAEESISLLKDFFRNKRKVRV
jgi:tRNA(adenine34) deaminase